MFRQYLRINLAGNTRNTYKARLVDGTGRILQEKNNSGENYLQLETEKLKAGAYLLRVAGDGIDQTFKILIQ